MRRATLIFALLITPILPACGGGGGEDPPQYELVEQRVLHTPSRTGTVYSTTFVEVGAETMAAGDLDGGQGARALLSFPLGSLPDPAEIQSITYVDAQSGFTGAPYGSLGDLVVVDTDIGPSLSADDYDEPPVSVVLGTLSTSVTAGPRSIDLTAWILSLQDAGAQRVDLMVRFEDETDSDGVADMVWLRSAGHAEGPGYLQILRRVRRADGLAP